MEDLNISADHLSKLEQGKRMCSFELLLAISEYFQVPTDFLLKGTYVSAQEIKNARRQRRQELHSVIEKLCEIEEQL